MGIPDHLTCILRNLYAGQEATITTRHGTTDWFKIGIGVRHGCILTPYLFNLHAEYIKQNAGLEEATVRTGHGTTYWFQIGKGAYQGCILSPYLFNLHAEYIT